MNQIIEINNQDVTFESNANGIAFTDSLTLGKVFDRQHKNVLRDIDNLPKDVISRLNFEPSNYTDARGKTHRMYKMSKKGLMLIAMGLSGEKALQWKVQYIDAFEALEAHYRNSPKAEPKKLNPRSKNVLHIETLATGVSVIDEMLYIRDLTLGEFMGYKRPHSLRKLVRNLIKRKVITEPVINLENYAETFYLSEDQVRSCIYNSMQDREPLLKRFTSVMNISCDLMDDEDDITDKEEFIDATTYDAEEEV